MNTNEELEETGIRRIQREILEATGEDAPQVVCVGAFASAEGVYRAVTSLRDLLSADAQRQLAVCFEWAREGIARQASATADLAALQAAYEYARDVMVEAAAHSITQR
jgi:hypothetical protein